MSEDKNPNVSTIELHEEFIQHIENGGGLVRTLSVVTVVVAALLATSYLSQLVLPYVYGVKSQTVNLVDPALQATELLLTALTLVWLYVGLRDYFFARRLAKQVKEIRAMEAEVAKKYGLDS
ncbi:MAG: hypothetical protein OK452_09830 [Thaumarchaeota archaeon]|nr:hypothetical protein [Nitrososphaerota archaeon]